MANYNFSRNNNRGLKAFAIIVTILLVAALVVGLFFIGKTTNGFTVIPEYDDDGNLIIRDENGDEIDYTGSSEDSGNFNVEEGNDGNDDSSLMSFSVSKLSAGDVSGITDVVAENYYGVQVFITPDDADVGSISWALTVSSEYYGTDGNGQSWLESYSIISSDYLVLETFQGSDDRVDSYCLISSIAPFGCQFVLTCTVVDLLDNSFSSSLTIDYMSYLFSEHISMVNQDGGSVSDTFGDFTLSYDKDSDSYSFTKGNDSSLSLDIDHLVFSSTYNFTYSVDSVLYTVGSVACESSFPSLSFVFTNSSEVSSSSSDWAQITFDLIGSSMGGGSYDSSVWNHVVLSDYVSSNYLFKLTVSFEGVSLAYEIYPVNYDSLSIPAIEIVIDPSEGIIFG